MFLLVARAFQPEPCPLRLECLEVAARSGASAGFGAHAKPRSREGKRTRAVVGVRCSVFGVASRGRESAGVSSRSSGFPARDPHSNVTYQGCFFATDEAQVSGVFSPFSFL